MSFKKLPLLLTVLLLTLCSNTYAFYITTLSYYATGNPGTDSTGWVNQAGTKVDNSMIVSYTSPTVSQRSWAIFKPNNPLPANAVVVSASLILNVTNVANPGSGACKVNIFSADYSQNAGPALYNN